MGNSHSHENAQKLFSQDELKVLEASFRATNGAHSDRLLKSWSNIIDPVMAQGTVNFLFSNGRLRFPTIQALRYAEPFHIVERGTIDDKLNLLVGSLKTNESNRVPVREVENYVIAVLRSYLKMKSEEGSEAYDSWIRHGYLTTERSILALSRGFIRSLTLEEDHNLSFDKLERWLQLNDGFLIMWRKIFTYLYSKSANKSPTKLNPNYNKNTNCLLPLLEGVPSGSNYMPVLELPQVIYINSQVPSSLRHKWRFLFSSKFMGESFSTMLGRIQQKGPTVIVVEDEDRYLFGGYAPASWQLCPTFYGDDSSILFTLSPAMRCFTSTNYNNHYQYLNLNQQTLPNGLGMGGQFNYWGLWLDREYGVGQSSESCTTYRDYRQLSKRKEFKIRNVEIWALGDEPKLNDDDDDAEGAVGQTNKRSVLDKNMEDSVMLELAGRTMHSAGLREPDMDL